jgi:radical SAM superfamily enzyme YgiQ (UPF0313 family)
MALASFLKSETTHQCDILDAQLDHLEYDELEAKIREYKPDVVGITCFTVQLVDVMESIRAARRAEVQYLVLGGPHINDFPKEALALEGVDAVVKGEGQQPLLELLQVWEKGGDAKGIEGVIAHVEDPIPTEDVYFSNSLDEYPIVDRKIGDYERYYDVMGQGGIFTTMVTSRGCPYRCTFCNTPRHRYRTMSPERICDEIEECIAMGIYEIYFVDDTFNITNQRVIDLCDEIIRRGLKVSWTVRFRVKGVDRQLVTRMKEAGCTRVQLGVEQGTEEGLLRLKKDVNLLEIESAFRICREVGIHTVAYFMLGTPVERSKQDVLDTIEYSIQLQPDFVMYNIMTPFPGTVLHDEGVRDGVLKLEPWIDFMKNPTEDFKAQVWDEHFTRDELRDLLHFAYRRFYWRPRFVAKNLLQIRNVSDLKRKAVAGLRLLVS